MTSVEIKEQALFYIENNLSNEDQLELVCALLSNISNNLYENGYVKESNSLLTCQLTIEEIIKERG